MANDACDSWNDSNEHCNGLSSLNCCLSMNEETTFALCFYANIFWWTELNELQESECYANSSDQLTMNWQTLPLNGGRR